MRLKEDEGAGEEHEVEREDGRKEGEEGMERDGEAGLEMGDAGSFGGGAGAASATVTKTLSATMRDGRVGCGCVEDAEWKTARVDGKKEGRKEGKKKKVKSRCKSELILFRTAALDCCSVSLIHFELAEQTAVRI